ncbi:hypothetical protein ACFLXP_04710 [Chloroflexota bacterium]
MSKLGELVYTDLVERGKSLQTARSWRGIMNRFQGVCGDKESYCRADVINYLADCRERAITQNSIVTMLRPVKLLWQILDLGEFPKLAMPKVKATDVNRPILDSEEIVRMIKEGKHVLDKQSIAYLALATTYGLRRGEMSKMSDKFVRGVRELRVETLKGGPVTVHKVPDEIKKHLNGFQTIDDRYMSRKFNAICNRVGLRNKKGYGWHSIRRRLATELITRGLPSLMVVRYMRWSDAWMKGEMGMLGIYVGKEQRTIDKEVFKVHPFLEYWNGGQLKP